ncbi:glycosyltransferase [Streptomyces sp. NPDC048002]|uniref:glycosyltransferase n=1 Tax=Streptomyces sp. NPDC048002 TaxID=3154344 RepID=UPI0033F20899
MPRIVIVSPPFLSHARPLSVLAAALRTRGAEVFFACSQDFEGLALEAGVAFVPLVVTRNANTGVAESTQQDAAEAARLDEFLDATRHGAVETLMTQARHRRADMLADPDKVFDDLRSLDERLRPDWYVVDQLSYAVTLALHCLRLRYATFCPGHPTYVLSDQDSYFGVPYDWPGTLRPDRARLSELLDVARDNDRAFTSAFDAFAADRAPAAPRPGRAFALTSPDAVVYAYPPLPWLSARPEGPRHLFAGHAVGSVQPLDDHWQHTLRRLRDRAERIVLVALGTFLAARDDVLRAVVSGARTASRPTALIVAAGRRTDAVDAVADDLTVVVPSVPQQALLPHVDAMVHHGGGNSFTECLRSGVPALVLPFSSDQFAVARDAERADVGIVHDPNRLTDHQVGSALDLLGTTVGPEVKRWQETLNGLGPDHAATALLEVMAPPRGT